MSDSAEQPFATLVQPHFAALYRAALRLTRHSHDAEDLVQDVCLRACSRLGELASVTNPRAWLMRVLYRQFLDRARRLRRRATVAVDDGVEAGSEDAGPERVAEARHMHDRIVAVWDRLEPEQRALLSLHAEGHALDELATIFNLNKNALSARLHRARQRLARLLAARDGNPALQLVETQR